jgi:hypothetical protein
MRGASSVQRRFSGFECCGDETIADGKCFHTGCSSQTPGLSPFTLARPVGRDEGASRTSPSITPEVFAGTERSGHAHRSWSRLRSTHSGRSTSSTTNLPTAGDFSSSTSWTMSPENVWRRFPTRRKPKLTAHQIAEARARREAGRPSATSGDRSTSATAPFRGCEGWLR